MLQKLNSSSSSVLKLQVGLKVTLILKVHWVRCQAIRPDALSYVQECLNSRSTFH
jgi:hypothetical protein